MQDSVWYMGAVSGVYLKYVGISAATGAIAYARSGSMHPGLWYPLMAVSLQNGVIACLFRLRRGMFLLGKNPTTGLLPLWSQLLWSPFLVPSTLYTWVHTVLGKRAGTPVATECLPGCTFPAAADMCTECSYVDGAMNAAM